MIDRLSSRKFLLCVASLAVNAWLLVDGVLPAGDYKALILATVAVYVAGNVAQKAVAKGAAQ